MKPSQLFLNLDDFSNRFKDTFIYYKGVPRYVKSVTADHTHQPETFMFVSYSFKGGMDSSSGKNILLDDEGINFRNYSLGYTQLDNFNALWLARTPGRQWKQGLRRDQLQIVGQMDDPMSGDVLQANRYTYDMLTDNYPTIREALDTLRANPAIGVKVPVHKNFALYRGRRMKIPLIEYKGVSITQFDELKRKRVLNPKFAYLLDVPEYSRILNCLMMDQND